MLRDWHALRLIRRGRRIHLFTDPACRFHHAPRPGSRLDRASRGLSCPVCMPPAAGRRRWVVKAAHGWWNVACPALTHSISCGCSAWPDWEGAIRYATRSALAGSPSRERNLSVLAAAASVLGLSWREVNAMPTIERCGSCGGVINPQTGECRCSD